MTVEVGARGFVAFSARSCLRRLGFPNREISTICKALSRVSAKCSYTIYLSRHHKTWDRSRALLTESHPWPRPTPEKPVSLVTVPVSHAVLPEPNPEPDLPDFMPGPETVYLSDLKKRPKVCRGARLRVRKRKFSPVLQTISEHLPLAAEALGAKQEALRFLASL